MRDEFVQTGASKLSESSWFITESFRTHFGFVFFFFSAWSRGEQIGTLPHFLASNKWLTCLQVIFSDLTFWGVMLAVYSNVVWHPWRLQSYSHPLLKWLCPCVQATVELCPMCRRNTPPAGIHLTVFFAGPSTNHPNLMCVQCIYSKAYDQL